MLVPPVAVLDRTGRASFRAALLLGLRQVLGGDPDHLDVVEAAEPGTGGQRWAMVLHDLVPGGTGYLARFTDPDRVRELLEEALAVLRNCRCRDEPVAACHRCLLPHVPPHLAPDVRRETAVELLDEILANWQPRPVESLRTIPDGETPIEKRFRLLLLRWAQMQRAEVKVQAGTGGDSATIHLPQSLGGGRWQLVPQAKLGGVQPDFVLTAADPQVPRIAVFCDSRRYHCSPEHNRLAEDADKRAGLRDQDYLVWAVTHRDLDAFTARLDGAGATRPAWGDAALCGTFRQVAQKLAEPGMAPPDALLDDTLSTLTAFLLHPRRAAWYAPARALTAALCAGHPPRGLDDTAAPALLREAFGVPAAVGSGAVPVVLRRSARGAVVAVERRSTTDLRPWIAVDDSDEVVGTDGQVDSWYDWLALGNLLQLVEPGRFHAHTRATLRDTTVEQVVVASATRTLPGVWQMIVDVSPEESHEVVLDLARLDAPVPEAGHEVDDGEYAVDLAWPDRWLAVSFEPDEERDAWLTAHGWTVLPPTTAAVRAALEGAT